MTRWNHFHTLATGLVFGLVLDKETLVVFGLGLALGVAGVFSWRFAAGVFGWFQRAAPAAADAVALRQRKTEAEIERKLAAAEESRTRAANRIRAAAEQRDAEKRSYYAGARDGGWFDDERPATILGVPTRKGN